MTDPSLYGNTLAEVYDDLYGDAPSVAIDTMADLIGPKGHALELGVGTGRFAIPLLERGIRVHGIDASQLMVDKLREKPLGRDIPVTIADFAHLPDLPEGPFDLAFCNFSSIFLLLTQKEQVSCFQSTARLLKPGGRFVIEAFHPDLSRYGKDQPAYVGGLERNEVMLEASRHDLLEQRVSCRFMRFRDGGMSVIPVELRYAWPQELDLMAQLAGMQRVERWAGWDRSPFHAQAFKHISVFEKQAGT
jgi:SAM-dependent methyltransferase